MKITKKLFYSLLVETVLILLIILIGVSFVYLIGTVAHHVQQVFYVCK